MELQCLVDTILIVSIKIIIVILTVSIKIIRIINWRERRNLTTIRHELGLFSSCSEQYNLADCIFNWNLADHAESSQPVDIDQRSGLKGRSETDFSLENKHLVQLARENKRRRD